MPLLLLFPPMLAEVSGGMPDPASAQSVGWIILSLAALFAAANQGMSFLEKVRTIRQPAPGDVSADRVKALEDRMHSVELKMENHMGQIAAQFGAISQTLTNLQADWNYAVGRIDGRTETNANHLPPS